MHRSKQSQEEPTIAQQAKKNSVKTECQAQLELQKKLASPQMNQQIWLQGMHPEALIFEIFHMLNSNDYFKEAKNSSIFTIILQDLGGILLLAALK